MKTVQSADAMQKAQREYLESRILAAQPVELIEILYQISIQSLKTASQHLKSGDAMARAREVSRAQEAVNELMASLDHSVGAPFTRTLAALYAYVQQQTLKGHAGQSEEAFQHGISVLNTLAEGWAGVRAEQAKAAKAAGHATTETAPPDTTVSASSAVSDRSLEYSQAVPAESRDWTA